MIKIFKWAAIIVGLSCIYVHAQQRVINNIHNVDRIQETINLIEQDSIYSYVSELQKFESRFELNENRFDVSQWIYDKFQSFGHESVVLDTFISPIYYDTVKGLVDSSFLQRNVICTIPGDINTDELCVIVAHYDSYTPESRLQFTKAPGADDNGSGISCLLEIARVIQESNITPKRTILLVASAAEELTNFGRSGAQHVANRFVLEDSNVSIVINVDMIGYTSRQMSHSLYIGREESSSPFAEYTKYVFDDYTNIRGVPVDYWGGDLTTFVDAGFYGLYFEEYDFNPAWHTRDDLLDNMHFEYCKKVIQGIAATVLQFCNVPTTIQINTTIQTSDYNNIQLSWNSCNDSDFDLYNLYLSFDSGETFDKTSLSDTSYTFQNNINQSDVRYAITAKNIDNYESIGIINELKIDYLAISESNIINGFELEQNYPNPFNPATQLSYNLPAQDNVIITIYNTNGHIIKELVNEIQSPGRHEIEWKGRDNLGKSVSSGIYIVSLRSSFGNITKKVTLIR